ncbi:MAG: response regulator transcription factor [Chloroflexota bacterium]
MKNMIRLLIVEDHFHLREQITLLMSHYAEIIVVGSTHNGQEAVALCAKLDPNVVLMDAMMPVMDGFTATELIRQQFPAIRVVILSNGFLGEDLRAIGAGASVFLLKPVDSEQMVQAIHTAHRDRVDSR